MGKLYLSLFLLFCIFSMVEGQGVFSQPRQAVLYRNYPNLIQIGLIGEDAIKVVGVNCTVASLGTNAFKVLTGKGKTCSVLVLNSKKDTIARQEYKVLTLPELTLKWGNVTSGGEVTNRTERMLVLSYPDEVAIVADQSIESYQLSVSGKSFTGKGRLINPEAQRFIQDANAGTIATFKVNHKDSSGKVRQITATFRLE